jgi:phage portal protein BeeE
VQAASCSITETSDGEIPIPANRIIHLEGITFDNMEAMELTKLMRDAWGLALAQMDFASRVYRTGGRKGGWLEIPLGTTKTSADKLEEGFRGKYEDPSAAFTTIILRDNAKFHEGQMTLRESQVLEGREESVRDVARAFNIRPGHLGVETTGVYGNKADDTRDYVDNTLRPHMAGIAASAA